MRILLISWNYPPATGGAEMQAQRLAGLLARRGHAIEVRTARWPNTPREETPHERLRVRRCFWDIPFGPLYKCTVFAQTALSTWRARGQFDIVHSQQASWGALGALLARRLGGPPVVVRVASSGPLNDLLRMRARRGGKRMIACIARADAIIALCRVARDEIAGLDIPPPKIHIIPNGIDLERYPLLPHPGPEHPPTILYVGRLEPIKGVDVLLRAFARVREAMPTARLVLAGDGRLRADLERQARALGLPLGRGEGNSEAGAGANEKGPAGTVEFLGLCADPRPLYAAAHALVLPSRTEGMSNVLLEAMASGRACVATAVGGNPDLLDPDDLRTKADEKTREGVFMAENGVLIPPENPEALAEAVLMILRNPDTARRLGESARKWLADHCSLDTVADRYERLYESLMRGKNSR